VAATTSALNLIPDEIRQAANSGLEIAHWGGREEKGERGDLLVQQITGTVPEGRVLALPTAMLDSEGSQNGWVIDGHGGDFPTPLRQSLRLPASPYWMDSAWLDPERPLPPSSLLEAWSVALADVRAQGSLMTILLNAHISGRPGIASQILRFIDDVIDSGDVWIAQASQISNWYAERAR
jgi:hypothetical protein